MKKVFISVVIFLVVVVVGILILGSRISKRALPDYSKPFVIKNLKDSVWIYRDSFAMPHVFAKNEADLYRVSGYLVAQDRMWQMDLLRHVTAGRLSEIFGADLLEADFLMRSLRIPEKSERLYQEISPEIKAVFEAYCDGINQYMEEYKDKLPPEFAILGYKPEPWKPQHSFNLVGYMAWDLNGSWIAEVVLHKIKNKLGREKVLELIPFFDSVQSVIYSDKPNISQSDWASDMILANQKLQKLGLSIFHGSNNWAVNSGKSVNGKPLLANDMHLGIMAPGVWYQMHQVVEGKLNVTGVMLPGAPFIISGHNEAVAWGMTNVMNDDIDFYNEKINPNNENQYFFEGTWKALDVRNEKIYIKGGDSVIRRIKFTHRGPIISELKGISDEAISMRWLGNERSNEIRTVYLLNRMSDWNGFKDAVKTFVSVSQNIVYADTAGNIGLYCSAGVPIRKGPAWEILPGQTTEYDWKGLVPFDSLPHYYNPASGIAVSANNKTAPANYPYYISYWYDLPFRYNRIHQMLTEKNMHSVETFKAIQTDFYSDNVNFYLPDLLNHLEKEPWTGTENEAFALLKNWDRLMDEGAEPAIYETFFLHFIRNLLSDELGEELYNEFIADKILVRQVIHRIWTTGSSSFTDNISTDEIQETLTDIVILSFSDAIRELTNHSGNIEDWNWGRMHPLVVNHPMGTSKPLNFLFKLNRGPYATGGSFHTVAPYAYRYTKPYTATHGASHRHIYVTGNWDESWTIIPTGICGIPSSPYYCNQTDLYVAKKYRTDWFSRQAVIKNAKYSVVLRPL